MRGEVAYAIVLFRTRVDDGGGVVREAGEVGAVFLAHERFYVLAFFGVVEQEGVVGAGGQAEFAGVVKVEGCDRGFGFGEFELLVMRCQCLSWKEVLDGLGEGEGEGGGGGGGGDYLGWSEGPYDFGGLLGELWSSGWRWWDHEGPGHCERPDPKVEGPIVLSRI